MGRAEREKGKRFERDVANWLKKNGFEKAMRSAQHSGKAGDAADVVGMPGIHLECKAVERPAVYDWIHQALRDSEGTGNIPVVIWKQNGKRWLAIMLGWHYLELLKDVEDFWPCAMAFHGKRVYPYRFMEKVEQMKEEVGQSYHSPVADYLPDDNRMPLTILYADDFMELYKEGYHGDL